MNESQEAILVKGGRVYDIFGCGTHTLDTLNIPLLNHIVKLPFDGLSPFTAEVWFINKAYDLDIKWGTPSPIQIQDPKYGIFAPVRSNGAFGIQIADSRQFLIKLVGTMRVFDKTSITKYFRGLYITKVKDAISTYLIHQEISILEINAYIDELSDYMKERIQPTMDGYGINLISFYINDISVPEDDPAIKRLKDALSKRAEMNIIGYNYQQERSFDTLEGAAKNTSSTAAPLMGAGLGVGMGLGMGQSAGAGFGAMAQQLQISGQSDRVKECLRCHVSIPTPQRFCGACGFDTGAIKNAKQDTAKASCSACGLLLTSSTKFCPQCGKKTNPCPKCGTDLPEGIKLCPGCGHAPPIACLSCGAMVPSGSKFCPECGERS